MKTLYDCERAYTPEQWDEIVRYFRWRRRKQQVRAWGHKLFGMVVAAVVGLLVQFLLLS